MKKFILGEKDRMTQLFDDRGAVHAVTVLRVEPNVITQLRTTDRDGYDSVQVGTGHRAEKKTPKPERGHQQAALKTAGRETYARDVREFRLASSDDAQVSVGDTLDVSVFEVGDSVEVSSATKGKGFQGGVKRWNFSGGPRTHGQKHHERAVGSIGAMGHERVQKGRKMPGRMGHNRVTVKNLRVMQVDPERNELYISGAIPGRRGSLVEVRSI